MDLPPPRLCAGSPLNLSHFKIDVTEKVYFRSQILEHPSIGEYWNISGVPVLLENVIFTFFRTCRCYSEAYNTGTQKWSSIVQYSCTSIWDLKYTFSHAFFRTENCMFQPCLTQNMQWHHVHSWSKIESIEKIHFKETTEYFFPLDFHYMTPNK